MIEINQSIYTIDNNIIPNIMLKNLKINVVIIKWKVIGIDCQTIYIETELNNGVYITSVKKEQIILNLQDAFEKAQDILTNKPKIHESTSI